jgi:type II secretory pathway pseudopilin PulG
VIRGAKSREKGYVLLGLLLAMTLMLIAMAAGAPRIAQQIRRQREEDLVHIGTDYATAIKRFVHKNGGRYPTSIEQLENTNHIRFLRKQYKDPTTGENIWRLVRSGEAEIKIPQPSPGLNQNTTNPGLSGGTTPPTGVPPSGIAGLNTGGLGQGNSAAGNASSSLGSLQTSNIGNGQQLGGGMFIGIASVNKAESIKEFNDKDHYNEWFFVYDLRLEQSGGTGVTIAAPRAGAAADSASSGKPGSPQPGATGNPAPTPPPQVPQ